MIEAEVKKTDLSKISKWSVMERLEDVIRFKEMSVLKKTERKKRGYEYVEGLDPANNEGGTKGRDCTLILVEGLSAKTYAAEGIQEGAFGKKGRDWFGIMALRGKVLNCRNASPAMIAKNKVITDIIKSIGVQYDVDYTVEENYQKLRYGRVLLIVDADQDGIHISGLIQNMFHALFPSLLKRSESFITAMQTPIVRVYGKSDKIFYDEQEYFKYVASLGGKSFEKKYYKGLGTSNQDEVAETFAKKIIKFVDDDKSFESMNKAFNKNYSDSRKEWLLTFNPSKTVLKWNGNNEEELDISVSDFIDTELIKFSIGNCARSIPNLMDGLKEGHRKVLYTCFKHKNLKYSGKPMKVAQIAGLVAFDTSYHHGEQILYNTITGMANEFVGSNNIPYLFRGGQFGTRSAGGDDAANGRYIFTKLDALTRLIFHPDDDVLLEYEEDDGKKIEPKYYVPIIPTILTNGCLVGIGTGWSCNVPCYNPVDLVDSIKLWLDCEGDKMSVLPDLKPWYRGHRGEMSFDAKRYVSYGISEKDDKGKIRVTELPVGYWTNDFTEKLEQMKAEKKISNYKNHSTPKTVDFTITELKEGPECKLDLHKYIHVSNMVLFTEEGVLKKYSSTKDILHSYCTLRYAFYIKRKEYKLKGIERQIKMLGNKKRFLEEVRDGDLKLFNIVKGKRESRKTSEIVSELEQRGYDKDLYVEKEKHDVEDEGDDDDDEEEGSEDSKKKTVKKTGNGYEYLLRLQISSVTVEKIERLKKDIDTKIEERDKLKETSEKDMWKNDLDMLMKAYYPYIESLDNISVKKASKKVIKKM